MGIAISLNSAPYARSATPDAISVTANWNGLTALRGYASDPKWGKVLNEEIIQKCNQNMETIALSALEQTLFLVPRTKGHGATHKLMRELFLLINQRNIKVLEFTHYACLRGNLPKEEILEILSFLFDPSLTTSLRKLIWRVDPSAEDEMWDIFFQASPNFAEK